MYIFSLKLQRRVVTIPRGMHDLLFYLFIEKELKFYTLSAVQIAKFKLL